MSLTAADIQKAVDVMNKHQVEPKRVKTAAQARRMRQFDRLIGIKSHWKVGDKYYEMHMHQDVVRAILV